MDDLIELPTGIDPDEYSGYAQWSSHRWAWEFLRRNVDFQSGCTEASSFSDKEKVLAEKRIANKFGLKKFKHFRELYSDTSRGGIPSFVRMSVWVSSPAGERKRLKTTLDEGDVVIRFNLLPALKDRTVIRDQVARAEECLKEQLSIIAARRSIVPKGRRDRKYKDGVNHQLYLLRLLDVTRSSDMSQPNIYKYLNENVNPEWDRDLIQEKFHNDVSKASEIANSRYINLALKRDLSSESD